MLRTRGDIPGRARSQACSGSEFRLPGPFMRQAILIVVVLVLALIALVRPRTGLYAYIWFALMRPDFFAWAAGNFPFSPVLAGATLAGSIRYFPRLRVLFQSSFTLALLLF